MAKQDENGQLQVVLFVEGDTDEVLFKELIDYYRSVSTTELNPCKMKKTYLKGYQTKELIAALDMAVIRHKNKEMLSELETALGALASER
jgi:hypothetical protein